MHPQYLQCLNLLTQGLGPTLLVHAVRSVVTTNLWFEWNSNESRTSNKHFWATNHYESLTTPWLLLAIHGEHCCLKRNAAIWQFVLICRKSDLVQLRGNMPPILARLWQDAPAYGLEEDSIGLRGNMPPILARSRQQQIAENCSMTISKKWMITIIYEKVISQNNLWEKNSLDSTFKTLYMPVCNFSFALPIFGFSYGHINNQALASEPSPDLKSKVVREVVLQPLLGLLAACLPV